MRWLLAFIAFAFLSCSINRTENGEREGLWVEKTEIGQTVYKSRGRYKNGFERSTWKYFENRKLVKKEVYKDSLCLVTHFKDGKKILEGQTRIRVTDSLIHWYYTGEWRQYDGRGNLVAIRAYNNGELISEVETVN